MTQEELSQWEIRLTSEAARRIGLGGYSQDAEAIYELYEFAALVARHLQKKKK